MKASDQNKNKKKIMASPSLTHTYVHDCLNSAHLNVITNLRDQDRGRRLLLTECSEGPGESFNS